MLRAIGFILMLMSSSVLFGQIFADNRPLMETSSLMYDTLRMAQNAEVLMENNANVLTEEGTGKRRRASKLYKELGYQASADLYRKMEAKGVLDAAVMARLGKSYRLNGDTENAEYWYSKVVNEAAEPSTIFHYAQVLQSNGKCEDAVRWYQVFNNQVKKKQKVNIDFIEDCSELNSFVERKDVQLSNISALNSESIDYCAVPFKQGVVFTSTRGISGLSQNTDKWTNENFSDLFYAERKVDGSYGAPISLANDVNGRYHDGVASFTGGQNVMYFSRNNRTGKSSDGMIDLKVYVAKVDDNNVWSDAKELTFNNAEYASCHPSVSNDGQLLYFASNRPGGFGGMDIYVSEKRGENWSTPINLGPTVNTVGNEIFPNLDESGVLYFASNGHRGLGGLDIFAVQSMSSVDPSAWDNRTNMGQPFNTSKDDFGFSMNVEGTRGYITSNRAGGRGADDIYEWVSKESIDLFDEEEEKTEEEMMVSTGKAGMNQLFAVMDMASGKPVNGAIVTFETVNAKGTPVFYAADEVGELSHVVPSGKKIKIIVESDGYETYTETVDAYDILKNKAEVYDLKLERRACTEINGVVMNNDCNKPLEAATIRVFNKCTGEEETFTTNRDGAFDACLKCGCDYEIIGNKTSFTEDRKVLSTMKANCDAAQPMAVKLNVSSIAPARAPVSNYTGVPVSSSDLRVGSVIALENIYYDYNKFTIRADATTDLDEVVALMKGRPGMEVELGSHTDSRGTDMYNHTLSMNRATAAVTYLVQKGIAPYRIVAKGYGESQLANHCQEGVDCSDEEHQQNRRTEIRITKMD